ncbi:MAG: CDP-diacylglycerol--glycerol-3-phosphate 3-phosphatidyltransferase [Sedimentisphaerales bacterium]|nr:CDP-diacylglycerol--glycerol-3-phosphate 3-phosphatidyltransferase [Sedimentisphaerales bacterium]
MLTGSRLGLAAGFFVLVAMAKDGVIGVETVTAKAQTQLFWAFVLFVAAGVTDILDGYLARRLGVTGKFGRTFDPLMDKALVIGAFLLLAWYGPAISGVAWWMVAVVIGREVLVTIIRHTCEAKGHEFAATWAGKLKMNLQCVAIGTVIIYLGWRQEATWAQILRTVVVWAAVVMTAVSAVLYLGRLRNMASHSEK